MPENSDPSAQLTRRAIVAYQIGHPEEARQLLAEAINADKHNELAWLWLAALARSDPEKKYCLERAIEINPEGSGVNALAALSAVKSVAPTYVVDFADLPRPHEIVDQKAHDQKRGLGWAWIGAAGAALLVLLAVVAFVVVPQMRNPKDKIYVALVAPLTGQSSVSGEEIERSIRLAVDRQNEQGGVDGHLIELLVYDDENDPVLARQRAEEIVADGRVLAVLGHNSSSATLAASDIYAAAGIPRITGTATADEVTFDNPWGFSTIFNNTAQGKFLATYVPKVLGERRVSVIYTDEAYGRSLQRAFVTGLPDNAAIANVWAVDVTPERRDESIAATVAAVAAAEDPGAILVAASRLEAKDLVLGLRRQGVTAKLVGADSMGSSAFAVLFSEEPEEVEQPGYFTDGIYAATPLIFDSAPGDAQLLAIEYRERYGVEPSWRGVKVYNSALALFDAIYRARIQNTPEAIAEDRTQIRDKLAALTNPESGVAGLDGPIFFDADGAGATPVSVGFFQGLELLSAPIQLQPTNNLGRVNLPIALAEGTIFEINRQYLQPVRVVYTGAAISELSDLDVQDGTAKLDFYLWFRYLGDDDATDVEFVNRLDDRVVLGEPIEQANVDGLNYRLFRVRGTFVQDLDFRDYPFDTQTIGVRFQNKRLPRDRIIYVVDDRGLVQASGSGGVNQPEDFEDVDDWQARGPLVFFQDTVSQESSLGDPRLFASSGKYDFSEFHIQVTLARELIGFLVRNILPLALILIILYISLFFSHDDQTTDRVSTAVTILLTAAVLLGAIYTSLPAVGYTLAIEYGFYVFFALTLGSVFLALIGSRLYKSGREEILRRIDLAARIVFPIIVLIAIVWYVVAYLPKFTS
jgi:ABC-type branched-subunit amino acid transport system substrate-binding protein